MKGLLQRVFRIARSNAPPIDYDTSKSLMQSQDPAQRRLVAANPEVKPEILYFLATDPDFTVRTAVAGNVATPVQADLILAGDGSEAVRADLARKISRFAPGLTVGETDRLKRMTYDVLETLIQDQAVRVRRIVAETLKDMPDAPVELVQRLARDTELAVSAPVLQYSPILNDDDLLGILNKLPIAGAATAIARRHSLPASVADVIGTGDDVDAIAALLSNPSAQIREETLDHIIDRAPQHLSWHRPLVDRPKLTDQTAHKLAMFVARDLIGRLRARTDLKPETVAELQQIVMGRLDAETGNAADSGAAGPAPSASPHEMIEEARRLKKAGELNEDTLVDALISGRLPLVHAGLAVLGELSISVVDKILSSHSAKGITALAWKAGLPMRFSVRLQTVIGRIPVNQVLKPRGDGGFPLSEEALSWQLDFFADMAASTGLSS